MNPRTAAGAGVLLIFAWAVWWWLAADLHDETSSVSKQPAVFPDGHAAGQVNAATAPVNRALDTPLTPLAKRVVSERLQQEFRDAADWRAFAISAMARPSEGGYFYAMRATSLCGRRMDDLTEEGKATIAQSVQKNGTVSSVQLQLVERMATRCAAFASGEAGQLYREVERRAADGADPLVRAAKAANAAISGGDHGARKAALDLVLATGDPLVASDTDLLRRSMIDKDRTFWFDGERFEVDRDGERLAELLLALKLAACQPNALCPVDDDMTLACIGTAACFDDRREYVFSMMTAGMTRHAVEQLERRIRTQVEAGNSLAFLPRPSR